LVWKAQSHFNSEFLPEILQSTSLPEDRKKLRPTGA
jgi:hypothetical protein